MLITFRIKSKLGSLSVPLAYLVSLMSHYSCVDLDPPAIVNCSRFPEHKIVFHCCMFSYMLFPLPDLLISDCLVK